MKARTHEDRGRILGRTRGLQAVRRRDATDSLRTALHACAPRTRVQEESCCESESKRAKAKSQAFDLGPRLPRHGLIQSLFADLASEFLVRQALASDLAY